MVAVKFLFLLAAAVVAVSGQAQQENVCCVDQPKPKIIVEKVGVKVMYRQATRSSRYTTSCKLFGWGRCTRYRADPFQQAYNVDVYQQKSIPQPCRKYACCHGFVMVKDVCYANHELEQSVNHVADIKDGLSDLGDVGLGDVFDVIHDVVG